MKDKWLDDSPLMTRLLILDVFKNARVNVKEIFWITLQILLYFFYLDYMSFIYIKFTMKS